MRLVRSIPSLLVLALVAPFLVGSACPLFPQNKKPGNPGDASLSIRTSSGETGQFDFDSSKDTIGVTAPAGRVFTATFVHPDPPFTLDVRINGNRVRENDNILFPLTDQLSANDVSIRATYRGKTYASDRMGTSGELFLQQLDVSDTDVTFRGNFNIVLAADMPTDTLTMTGFLEAYYGGISVDFDAGF